MKDYEQVKKISLSDYIDKIYKWEIVKENNEKITYNYRDESKTPSFIVYTDTNSFCEFGSSHVFSSGKNTGDLIDLVKTEENIENDQQAIDLININTNKYNIKTTDVIISHKATDIKPIITQEIKEFGETYIHNTNYNYLTNVRGLDGELCKKYKLSEPNDCHLSVMNPHENYNSHVLFPIYYKDELVFFQYRGIVNGERRFLNIGKHYFFNADILDEAYNKAPIIITEGVINSISCEQVSGFPSIGLLGINNGQKLIDLILSKENARLRRYILFCDKKDNANRELYKKFKKARLACSYFDWRNIPDESIDDVNDLLLKKGYGRDFLGSAIEEYNSITYLKSPNECDSESPSSMNYLIDATLMRDNRSISSGYNNLDGVFENGGFSIGSYNMIMAPTNHYKTTILMNIAARMIKNKKRILILSCEESILDITMRKLFPIISQSKDINVIQSNLIKLGDTLVVKYWNEEEYTVEDIQDYLDKTHKDFDAVFVDYIDRLSSRKKIEAVHELQLHISKVLEDIATMNDLVMITATQTNRSAFDGKKGGTTDVASLASIGASYSKTHPVHFIAQVMQTVDDKKTNLITLHINKNRYGEREVDLFFQFIPETMEIVEADIMDTVIVNTSPNQLVSHINGSKEEASSLIDTMIGGK